MLTQQGPNKYWHHHRKAHSTVACSRSTRTGHHETTSNLKSFLKSVSSKLKIKINDQEVSSCIQSCRCKSTSSTNGTNDIPSSHSDVSSYVVDQDVTAVA